MSFSVPQNYVEQFSSNVHMLSEQKISRLSNRVVTEDVTGESFAVERAGSVEAEIVADLHGDTPLIATPHTRRWGFIKTFDAADLLDNESKVKLLIDPMSIYSIKHSTAMGRKRDEEIIAALSGNAAQGKNGGTSVALPAASKFTATGGGGTKIQFSDLLEAQERLNAAEVDEMFMRTCVLDAAGFRQLLEITEVKSADFNMANVLNSGRLSGFLGFDFVRSQKIPGAGTSAAKGYFFAQPAVRLGVASSAQSAVDPRPDKRRAMQIYTWQSLGAVRVEDEMVQEMTYDAS